MPAWPMVLKWRSGCLAPSRQEQSPRLKPLPRCGEATSESTSRIDRTEYAARRPQTVDKTINVPFTHGINWIPGATSARYICAAAGHIVGFTMEQEYCDVGLSNATERSLDQRIANNIAVQDYLSHQMLFLPMFQHSANLFAVAGTVAEWDPYNSQDVLPNRPESIVLASE